MNNYQIFLFLITVAVISGTVSNLDKNVTINATIENHLTSNPSIDEKIMKAISDRQTEIENDYVQCDDKCQVTLDNCLEKQKISEENSDPNAWVALGHSCYDWSDRCFEACKLRREGMLLQLKQKFESYSQLMEQFESQKEQCTEQCSTTLKECSKLQNTNCYGEFQLCNDPCVVQYSKSVYSVNKNFGLLTMFIFN